MLKSIFITKLRRWEYWPIWITNIPVVFFWLSFAIRARKLFFFSTVNPVIETGGVLGESKINILRRIPQDRIPITVHVQKSDLDKEFILTQIEIHDLKYPIIFKPNIGERGYKVALIQSEKYIEKYLIDFNGDLLIQEYVSYPLELSVMYHRLPGIKKGNITSVCIKKTLSVKGDGKSTVRRLMHKYHRSRLQLERFGTERPDLLDKILVEGEELELEPIGNHSRGTTFLNGNNLIDEDLIKTFDDFAMDMYDIYYGRFDLKCASIDSIKKGKDFKVLEFNGVAGEPAHIFDPSFPIWKAYRDIYKHWRIIYRISKIQLAKGVQPMTLREVYQSIVNYLDYMKTSQIK